MSKRSDTEAFLKGMQFAIDLGEGRPRGITVLQAIKRENARLVLRLEQEDVAKTNRRRR